MEYCSICGKSFSKLHGLHTHLSTGHKFTIDQVRDYYDKHYKKEGEGICPFTGVPTEFLGLSRGYAKFSNDPITKKKSLATNSVEYLMKVRGMSEADAMAHKVGLNKYYSENNKRIFAEGAAVDPSYVRSMSRYCKEFWMKKGYSEELSVEKAKTECAKNRAIFETKLKTQPEKYNNRWQSQLQYWLDKGYTIEDARLLLRERQRTFTKEKLIKKYGEIEGITKWNNRQKQWLSNYKKTNFSRNSQLLFIDIYNKLANRDSVFFAVLDENKQIDWSGINHEYVLKLNSKTIKPDFIDIKTKKIIEFDGAYWHGDKLNNKQENKKRNQERDELLRNAGYAVLHIHELHYYKYVTETIDKCVKFLTDESI